MNRSLDLLQLQLFIENVKTMKKLGMFLLVLSTLSICTVAAHGSTNDVESIKTVLELGWKSLNSLTITVEDQPDLRPDGSWDDTQPVLVFERTTSAGSLQRMDVYRRLPNGKRTVMESFHENGRKHFEIIKFGETEIIDKIEISNQRNTSSKYQGSMNGLYWLMMPFGSPPFQLFDEGGKLVTVDENGESRFCVETASGVRIELDKNHDWIPKRLWTADGFFDSTATEFKRVDGHWFPMAGKNSNPSQKPNATSRRHFRVTNIEVNKSISPKLFLMPNPNIGTEVINKERNTVSIYGGIRARDRILEGFKRTKLIDRNLLLPEIPQSRFTAMGIISFVLIVVAVVSLSLGAYLKVGRRG